MAGRGLTGQGRQGRVCRGGSEVNDCRGRSTGVWPTLARLVLDWYTLVRQLDRCRQLVDCTKHVWPRHNGAVG